ncbi:MAG: response regulator transcription factor [Planctomycetota bacterium]|jgi:FixJ family two-component response regulator
MTSIAKQHIFFVDDNPEVRNVVGRTLKQVAAKVSCFACATDCLEQLRYQRCDLLITDEKMPGMSGIELLTEAKRLTPWLPVLVITGYGDIPMAVRAMKTGALDFILKPLDRESFLRVVRSVLERNARAERLLGNPLTKRENIVLRLIMDGKTFKEIGEILHRTTSTINFHRRNIYDKFGVNNKTELIKRCAEMELL